MTSTPLTNTRLRTLVRVWVDALTYAVVVLLVTTVFSLTLAITTGGGFVRSKYLLFIFGWLMMAYATAKLWVATGRQRQSQTQQAAATTVQQTDGAEPGDSVAQSHSLRSRLTNDRRNRSGPQQSIRAQQDVTRFQKFVQLVPPNRFVQSPPPDIRLTVDGKLFLSSVLVLALSFAMEVVFGIE